MRTGGGPRSTRSESGVVRTGVLLITPSPARPRVTPGRGPLSGGGLALSNWGLGFWPPLSYRRVDVPLPGRRESLVPLGPERVLSMIPTRSRVTFPALASIRRSSFSFPRQRLASYPPLSRVARPAVRGSVGGLVRGTPPPTSAAGAFGLLIRRGARHDGSPAGVGRLGAARTRAGERPGRRGGPCGACTAGTPSTPRAGSA